MWLKIKVIFSSLCLLFIIVWLLDNIITQNISISEPIGYYVKLPISGKIKRGDKYLICITNKQYIGILKNLGLPNTPNQCQSNAPYLIKQVAGIPNDIVKITKDGVLINNKLQPNSFSFKSAHGISLNPIPIGYKTILGKDEYFLLGITPHSVDSRYFGIVKKAQIYKHVILIFKGS